MKKASSRTLGSSATVQDQRSERFTCPGTSRTSWPSTKSRVIDDDTGPYFALLSLSRNITPAFPIAAFVVHGVWTLWVTAPEAAAAPQGAHSRGEVVPTCAAGAVQLDHAGGCSVPWRVPTPGSPRRVSRSMRRTKRQVAWRRPRAAPQREQDRPCGDDDQAIQGPALLQLVEGDQREDHGSQPSGSDHPMNASVETRRCLPIIAIATGNIRTTVRLRVRTRSRLGRRRA